MELNRILQNYNNIISNGSDWHLDFKFNVRIGKNLIKSRDCDFEELLENDIDFEVVLLKNIKNYKIGSFVYKIR